VLAVFAVLALAAGVAVARAQDSGWVKQADQTVLSSSAGLEDTNARPTETNLCEGTGSSDLDILFEDDPPWVRVGGSPDPHSPFVFAEGQVLPDAAASGFETKTNPFVTHSDAFFDHYTKDINVFVTLDKPYRGMLATGNFGTGEDNERAQLEVEWERGGVPLFAYPATGDRIKLWGNHIWDCGHDEGGIRAEIHPPVGWVSIRDTANTVDLHGTPADAKRTQDPWVWYEAGDRQGMGATLPASGLLDTPVQSSVADAYFSSWGGQTMEALNGCRDQTIIPSGTTDAPCDLFQGHHWEQPVLDQDYTFFIPAPPKPTSDAVLIYGSEDHCSEVPANPANPNEDHPGFGVPPDRMFGDIEDVGEAGNPVDPFADNASAGIGSATCNIPDAVAEKTVNGQPGLEVTVKAQSGGATYPANGYVAYAKRWKVAWDYAPPAAGRVHTYRIDVNHLRVYDDAEPCLEDGEWVMLIHVNDRWIYPVRGSGDDGDPFWAPGAVDDDKCIIGHDPTFKEYSIGETLTTAVVPGQELRFRERSYDVDFFSNDLLQPIDFVVPLPLASNPQSFEPGDTNTDDEGAHTIGFSVTDVSDPVPDKGTLSVGTPQYGPNADTGGVVRVNGSAGHVTPITFQPPGSGADGFEYRLWKDGSPIPATWQIDMDGGDGFPVVMPGASADSGTYTIEWATIRSFSGRRIVSERDRLRVQLDNTPPTLTVPADLEVFATETAGAHVTYTFSATDNFPGPITASCAPASGELFPNGHNAPLTTTVTCSATDAVQNTATKSFHVTVKSPFGYVPDYVLLGRDWVNVGSGVIVKSGNVGAFDASAGVPQTNGFEIVAGPSALFQGGSQIAGQSDLLTNSTQAGDMFYVDKFSLGNGATATPKVGYVPLFFGMPLVPAFSAGGANLSLNGTQTLPPGSYGAVSVSPNANITLSGGSYTFSTLEVKPGSTLAFAAPTFVGVAERVLVGNGAHLLTGSGVSPRDVLVVATGVDGPPNKPANAIDIGGTVDVQIDAYAPNGTLSLGSHDVARGAFLGRRVVVGSSTTVELSSSFLSP
jgi:hypothetical protein